MVSEHRERYVQQDNAQLVGEVLSQSFTIQQDTGLPSTWFEALRQSTIKAVRANLLAWHQGRAGSTRCLSAADGAPECSNHQEMSNEGQLGIVIFATSLASSLRKCL